MFRAKIIKLVLISQTGWSVLTRRCCRHTLFDGTDFVGSPLGNSHDRSNRVTVNDLGENPGIDDTKTFCTLRLARVRIDPVCVLTITESIFQRHQDYARGVQRSGSGSLPCASLRGTLRLRWNNYRKRCKICLINMIDTRGMVESFGNTHIVLIHITSFFTVTSIQYWRKKRSDRKGRCSGGKRSSTSYFAFVLVYRCFCFAIERLIGETNQ